MASSSDESEGFPCPSEICGKVLKTLGALSRHVDKYHPEIRYYTPNQRNSKRPRRTVNVELSSTPAPIDSTPNRGSQYQQSPTPEHDSSVPTWQGPELMDGHIYGQSDWPGSEDLEDRRDSENEQNPEDERDSEEERQDNDMLVDGNTAGACEDSGSTTGGLISSTFHSQLNAIPCDEGGKPLTPSQGKYPPPPPRADRPFGDWFPFKSQVHYEMAEFVYNDTRMSEPKANLLMNLISRLPNRDGQDRALFKNHDEICATIDATDLGEIPWQRAALKYRGELPATNIPQWMNAEYEVFYRDPREVAHSMIANSTFDGFFDYVPHKDLNQKKERQYENLMSGDWAWRQADEIANTNEDVHGAMFVPIILGSDKTTVSVATGQNEFWPLYMSLGNIHNRVRRARGDAVVLIGFLSIPKTDRANAESLLFRNFRRQMFHASLTEIFSTLEPAMSEPEIVRCPDGHFRRVIYGFGPYIADYPEQVLLACIVQNWCPKCTAHYKYLDEDERALRRTEEHTKAIVTHFELITAWEEYGIVANAAPFTENFPRAEIYEIITPDILHQLIKGTFKDHLVDWVHQYLEAVHGQTEAKVILADIDRRIAAAAPFTGLRRFPQGRGFKQWTGDDSKALMKVYLPAIEGYVPAEMLQCFRAFLEFCYLARRDVITDTTLGQLKNALERFHNHRLVFRKYGISPGLSMPRQHSMMHYFKMIRDFGAPNGLCSSITEAKHIKAVKEPWRRTNHFDPLDQMLYINQRLDKVSAMRTDFTRQGMLPASALRAKLDEIETYKRDYLKATTKNMVENEDDDDDDEGTSADRADNLLPSQVKLVTRVSMRLKFSDMASKLDDPGLIDCFRRYLYGIKYPDNAATVSINACPNIDPKIAVFKSAKTRFFAPSDSSGVTGHKGEHIRATPSWRKGPARYDTILVKTGAAQGRHGLAVARVRLLFSFSFEGNLVPTALVEWFSHVGDMPDEDTGMWVLERMVEQDGSHKLGFIPLHTILRTCHLLPVYGNKPIPLSVSPDNSLDLFRTYYLNKYADHHAFEILHKDPADFAIAVP